MEIERKYLTTNPPDNLKTYPHLEISQCYISKSPTIRLRNQDNKFILTVKGHGHIAREEFELVLTLDDYTRLLKKAEPPIITKTRYLLPLPEGLIAEVDVFAPPFDGLILTEVEFLTQEAADNFVPPDWFGQDVSLDPKYKNSNLGTS